MQEETRVNEAIIPEIRINTVEDSIPPSEDSNMAAKQQEGHASTRRSPRHRRSCLYRGSSRIVMFIEHLCGKLGSLVATYPWGAISVAVFFTIIAAIGLYKLKFELRPYKLWVKEPSEFKEVHEWRIKNFPNNIRKHIGLWEMNNVLTAEAIKQMWIIHKNVSESSSDNGVTYSDVCLKVPTLASEDDDYEYNYDYESSPNTYPPLPVSLPLKSGDTVAKFASGKPQEPDYEYNYYDSPESTDPEPLTFSSWLSNFEQPSAPSGHFLSDEEAFKKDKAEHCKFVEELNIICYEESLLDVFGYNEDVIKSLTDEKVIKDINEATSSRVTGFPLNITSYLGGIERDSSGTIVSAKGALQVWYTRVDIEAIRLCETTGCKIEIDLGSGEEVDEKGMEWEVFFSRVVDGFKAKGMPINLQASYLFGAVHRIALFKDFIWVCAGWGCLMLYVIATLAKPFTSESRIFPVFIGITCVGLSVLASYGICTYCGIPYGPLNSVLPVLLVALGVDDMFVILNAWDSNAYGLEILDVKALAKKTLHQAGLAITVTSLTDVIAFIIGATTDVPALRYFCVYAAVGITVVYFLQVTLFAATFVLHQNKKRDSDSRSCLPKFSCLKSSEGQPKESWSNKIMGLWAKFLLKPQVSAIVCIGSGFLIGGSLCQVLYMQQRFESVWLLPQSSDIYRWFRSMDKIFPKEGREGFIYFEGVKLPEEVPELQKLTNDLTNLPYVSRVDAWYDKLLEFIQKENGYKNKNLTKDVFQDALSYFLSDEAGAKYRNDFIFTNGTKLNCSLPAPEFSIFKIHFQYFRLENNMQERQNAMADVRRLVSEANISGYKAPWALSYGQWETENVISYELMRNVLVVLAIVFVMTMVLLASLRAAILVIVCVLGTLLDVSALMHLWGLTINTVTCIALVIAIGICVDYAAHITHGFLKAQGSKRFRAEAALKHMGPAVFHGGVSTLIAFLLLAPSDTFIFISYFKILTGVAVFGLFHALVLLPVLLVSFGPPPYPEFQGGEPDDSESCTTESTNFPCTPNTITPAHSPESSNPNSPTSSRSGSYIAGPSKTNDSRIEESLVHESVSSSKENNENKGQKVLGSQALENLNLVGCVHKINMLVEGEKSQKLDSTLEDCAKIKSKHKENVVKIYVKDS